MNIVHFSDPHIMGEGLLHGVVDTGETFSLALRSLAESGKKIDLIVVSGDLANSGALAAYGKLSAILKEAVRELGCEILLVPGNHDDRENFSAVFPAVRGAATGRLDQRIRVGKWQLIGLDTLEEGHDYGGLTTAQTDWLGVLARDPECPHSIVVMHHPPIDSPTSGMTRIGLRDKGPLASALSGGNVRLILAGHYHHFVMSDFAGAKVVVASSTAYQIDPLSPEDLLRGYQGIGFNFMTVQEDGSFYLTQIHRSYPLTKPVLDASLADLGI